MKKWSKFIIAGVAILVLEAICHCSLHTLHPFLLPVELAILAWGGYSIRKCIHRKCKECTDDSTVSKLEKTDEKVSPNNLPG